MFKMNPQTLAKIRASVETAFLHTVALYSQECTRQIESEIWEWPNPPSPRDVANTGRLRDSQQVSYQELSGGIRATLTWDPVDPDSGEHYGLSVHNGQVLNGRVLPGRAWTEPGLESVAKTFAREARALL